MTPRRPPGPRPFAHLSSAPPHDKPAAGALPLTARQQQILDWIRGHIDATACRPRAPRSPTGLGFSTPSSAEDHLQALARKGALEILPGASRGLRSRTCRACRCRARCRSSAASPRAARSSPPSTSKARYRVDPALFSPRADYLLRVRGASMRDAGILDGDLLAVHRTSDARSGQIVVAR